MEETYADSLTDTQKSLKEQIARFVEENHPVTVGAIKRNFEEHTHEIWSVLIWLKDDGIVNFDDHRPPPTIVRYEASRKILPLNYGGTLCFKDS